MRNVTDVEFNPIWDNTIATWWDTYTGYTRVSFGKVTGMVNGTVWICNLTIHGVCTTNCSTALDYAPVTKLVNDTGAEVTADWTGGTFNCTVAPCEDKPNEFIDVWSNTNDPTSKLTNDVLDICSADLDEDGKEEIIVGDMDGYVTVFENAGNNKYVQVWQAQPESGKNMDAVAVCDMNNDGRGEIICGGENDTVYVYEWTGKPDEYSLVSVYDVGADINDLCCSDIDEDDEQELGIAAGDHAYLYNVSTTGWTWNKEFDSGDVGYDVYSALCCCDLNNNSHKEFIFGEWDYDTIHIYESTGPNTYILKWEEKVGSSDGKALTMTCCDINKDGYQELFIGDEDGQLIVVNNTGDLTACSYSLLHEYGYDDVYKLDCCDQDGCDCHKDLYLAIADGTIRDLEFTGTDVTSWADYTEYVIGDNLNPAGGDAKAVHVRRGCEIGAECENCADLDKDGLLDVVAGYEHEYYGPEKQSILFVLEQCPNIKVEETVYDPAREEWVKEITGAQIGDTFPFRINVTACGCNFTGLMVNVTLSPSLSYANNAVPFEPTQIGSVYQWTFSTLNASETKTIQFDVDVSEYGYDCNVANATALCMENDEWRSDADVACIESHELKPDLIVDTIDINPGCYSLYDEIIVNESNEIRARIKNVGERDVGVGETFDVCFTAPDASGVERIINCTSVTGPLNVSDSMTVSIYWTPNCADYPAIMPGWPCSCNTSVLDVLNVTVDCNCTDCPTCTGSGRIAETDEGNNRKSKAADLCNNGYKSKNFDCDVTEDPLTLFEYDEFYGGVVYNVSGTKDWKFEPGETQTRVHHIDIPAGMEVKKARLYLYWYDYFYNTPPGCLANLSINFSGTTFTTPDAAYTDQKGFGTLQRGHTHTM